MMDIKGITMVWLSKTDLSNINAGEGGGGNVTELKTYDNGRKPYASGQSVRHALREAIERNNPDVFLCTPESPCGDVKNCWLCDLFGYLNPKLDEGSDRRWSPIKATPALGQIANDIVTDLLIRMSDREKSDDKQTRDQRIAYVQIMSNVYRTGLSLDFANIGMVIRAKYEGKGKNQEFAGWETDTDIGIKERQKRSIAVLEAIGGIADFAKQARNATSLSPDIFIASTHSRYSHRTLRALECDDEGNVKVDTLRVILQDLQDDGATVFFGFTPGVVKNGEKLLETVKEFGLEPVNPIRALRNLTETVQNAENENREK
ncbi:MAG: type I-B CRISPR-associated protein Cas7/Cst2/DevR [Gemmatimonadetes bacterium]|nr:type I-B CRISPR-associated protein Cas7/Cst2/DevR [Gemmatimonadota bacterium]